MSDVEGLFPSFGDHPIARYITQIRRQIEQPAAVDEAISLAIAESRAEAAGIENVGPRSELRTLSRVPLLLRVRDPDWEAPAGIAVQSRLGNIVSAFAPPEQLEALRDDKEVESIESSREGGTPELADSKPFVRATDVHRPPIAEKGDSAIVAIIDTGVDVLHEAFLDGNGKTRILSIWDQRESSGKAPNAVDPTAFSQTYGSLYLQSQIQDMVDKKTAPSALRDPARHGTHVASIAAGRGVGPFAGGIAPDAKLIVVIPHTIQHTRVAPGDPQSLGYSLSHVDALSFIQSAAAKEGLPVAVNVSLGMNAGAHDGSAILEDAIDGITGRRFPGVVIVKSAGNERGHKGHAPTDVAVNAYADITWDSSKDYS